MWCQHQTSSQKKQPSSCFTSSKYSHRPQPRTTLARKKMSCVKAEAETVNKSLFLACFETVFTAHWPSFSASSQRCQFLVFINDYHTAVNDGAEVPCCVTIKGKVMFSENAPLCQGEARLLNSRVDWCGKFSFNFWSIKKVFCLV